MSFLSDDRRAKWIRFNMPFSLEVWENEYTRAFFRRSFSITGTTPSQAILTIRAMKLSEVSLDGRLIAPMSADFEKWKSERVIDLSPFLTTGRHELRITVLNKYGPALLIVSSDVSVLNTGEDWESSLDGSTWIPVVSASRREIPALSRMFPDTSEAFLSKVHFFLPLSFLVFLLTLASRSDRPAVAWAKKNALLPSRVRWVLIGLWVVLAINDIYKVPLDLGYDVPFHYEYISYIVKNHRIPLASEGWQMFQSPLYYMLSACFYLVLSIFIKSGITLSLMMRILPLFCGLLQVEVTYRVLKNIFPARDDLQILGIIVGGLLPMNMYISQFVGNEPLAGIFSAVVVMMSLRFFQSDSSPIPKWYLPVLGLVLGLALLSKVTPFLLSPLLVLFLIHALSKRRIRKPRIALSILLVFGIAFVVCGWYYLRNWVELGKPFVGGWDLTRDILWWQDPGYRTIHDFLRFGTSLKYPIFAGVEGFWDSIYSTFWADGFLSSVSSFINRPPWNYNFMISGILLSLVPAAAILIGMLKTVFEPSRSLGDGRLFCVCCILTYFAALLYHYISVPIYSNAKATYTLGLIPCYAVTSVVGLDILTRSIYGRALINAAIACWGVAAYCTYFVL